MLTLLTDMHPLNVEKKDDDDNNMFGFWFLTDATLLSRRVPNEGTWSIARESVSYI